MPPLKNDDEVVEEETLRDTLESAFKGDVDDDTTPDAESEDEAAKTSSNKDVDDGAEKKDDEEADKSKSDDEDKKAADKAKSDGDKDEDKGKKPFDPPARWTKEEKEQFSLLDPKVQELLLKRNKGLESDYTRKMTELAQERTRFNALEQVIAPRRETFARMGLDDARGLNMVLSYWDQANRDPMAFIDSFARERGIDLASVYGPTTEQIMQFMQGSQDGEDLDGQSQAGNLVMHPLMQKKLEELQQQVTNSQQGYNQLMTHLQTQQRAQSEAYSAQAARAMQEFRDATGDDGQPLYPFFEDVRTDMAGLMKNGYATTLADAYTKAVRMRDDIWSKQEESREISRRRAEEERIAEEAAKAKRAGAPLSAAHSAHTPPASRNDKDDDNKSIRELLKDGFASARASPRL